MDETPVAEHARIASLDVLRGFALLGILLLNIVGFGLPSAAYSYPPMGFIAATDPYVWAGVELFAEGAMRCLFSILFGAGVVLFTTGASAKSGTLHFRRNFWLLCFGLLDAYVLLWSGDILLNYALAGALLFLVRDAPARRLLIMSIVLIVMMSAMYGATQWGLGGAQQAANVVAEKGADTQLPVDVLEAAAAWEDFKADFYPTDAQIAEELEARSESYFSAFRWNAKETNNMLLFVLPLILFWDALAMMLLGMALYKYGVLQGQRSNRFYVTCAGIGFTVGLSVNGWEVYQAFSHEFALLSVFAQAQWTYHLGRLGMAMGYLGLIMLFLRWSQRSGWSTWLAAVGRMALTNYLMHSLLCLIIFTGAGLALVGQLSRTQLYAVVAGIWLLQLLYSRWWLQLYNYGPVEWLWRGLTYGRWPALRRVNNQI